MEVEITVELEDELIRKIDEAVASCMYSSREDFIVKAVSCKLRKISML